MVNVTPLLLLHIESIPWGETKQASTLFITKCATSLNSQSIFRVLSSGKPDNNAVKFSLLNEKTQSHN